MMKIKNEASGSIYYGMHFYPGCAQYTELDKSYCVFLNDDTIRSMGPSFAGKPVFVHHVAEVENDINKLRGEADGWVVDSFYNAADGKHWVKFIVVSDKAEQAIRRGMRLSNCYIPKKFGPAGTWNGISYEREITGGEYEHLAIVPNPRYEESIIMTPEKFKEYNDEKLLEIKKLANNKGDVKMKFSWFKKQKVENSTDLDGMFLILPKSGKEVEIAKLINEADEVEVKKDDPKMAHPDHLVEVKGEKMTVNQLMEKYNAMCETKNESSDDDDAGTADPASLNAADEDELVEEKEDEEEIKDSKKNEEDAAEKELKEEKKKNAKEKADRLRNANNMPQQTAIVELSMDQIARGKQRYGSGN